jgi:hypothetical protein
MHANEFDRILDECLDRLASGETIEQCLVRYSEQASRLEPLLRVAHVSRDAYEFEPSPDVRQQARARFAAARADRLAARRPARALSLLDRIMARPLPLAAVASLGAIALTMLLVVAPSLPPGTLSPSTVLPGTVVPGTPPEGTSSPSSPSTPTTPATPTIPTTPTTPSTPPDVVPAFPAQDGNFVFYLSDAPNDIADFESLSVTIQSIELKPRDGGPAVSITPDGTPVDLTPLQGDLAQELWRGDVPEGDYTAVLVHISVVEGVLAESGESADVILPSDKLRVITNFSVGGDDPTTFVFDITVHRTGYGTPTRYILSPQADESGVNRPIQKFEPQGNMKAAKEGQQQQADDDTPGKQETPHNQPPARGRDVAHPQDDSSEST